MTRFPHSSAPAPRAEQRGKAQPPADPKGPQGGCQALLRSLPPSASVPAPPASQRPTQTRLPGGPQPRPPSRLVFELGRCWTLLKSGARQADCPGKDWVLVPAHQLSPQPGHKPLSRRGLNTLALQQSTHGPSTHPGNNHQDPPAQRAGSLSSCPTWVLSPQGLSTPFPPRRARQSWESTGYTWAGRVTGSGARWSCVHIRPTSLTHVGAHGQRVPDRAWGRPGGRCPQQPRPACPAQATIPEPPQRGRGSPATSPTHCASPDRTLPTLASVSPSVQ